MIDLYCERVGTGLLAEPVNAITNLGFLLASLAVVRRAQRAGRGDELALGAILGAIGVGSTLFHTFASTWAQWLDVLPILAFEIGYLGLYLRRINHLAIPVVAATVAAFALTLVGAGSMPMVLNGSLGYVPAAVVLAWLGLDTWRHDGHAMLAAAAMLFGVSLCARGVDLALCADWPTGTHWLWHLLNAGVLYLALGAYVASPRRCPQGVLPSLSGSASSRTHSDIEPS